MNAGEGFVLPVDKPEGPTSHDVVDAARRGLGQRRIGHTGTLDPFASGLLVLCVGRATRLAEYLSGLDKAYDATARLGVATDTLDRDGREVARSEGWRALTRAQVADALGALEGPLRQVPPQYSAKKVEGVAMHRRARGGETVDLEPCDVTVHAMELVALELPDVRFRVACSSGTYVRALARDLGEALGVGAHLTALRRTRVGHFRVEDALPVAALGEADAVAERAVAPLAALAHLPTVSVDEEAARRLAQGQRLRLADGSPSGLVAVEAGGGLLAVAEVAGGLVRPRKVFAA